MAAVPPGNVTPDPDKETVGSLGIIRRVLDGAQTVEEAVKILGSYNIDFQGGPPIHYLIADRSGKAVLVEFYQGEMQVLPNAQPWHQATNFLRSAAGDSTAGQCWRYDKIGAALGEAGGRLGVEEALGLLESVAQANTQWSVVYGISSGEVRVVVGQKYDEVHTFKLEPGEE
jgi:choloylglycine hydrolase